MAFPGSSTSTRCGQRYLLSSLMRSSQPRYPSANLPGETTERGQAVKTLQQPVRSDLLPANLSILNYERNLTCGPIMYAGEFEDVLDILRAEEARSR